jgi:peptidoglycan/xylan/chitin deacetylase (PgdA/CDA1 family)
MATTAATAAGIIAWGAVAPSSELFGPTLRRTDSSRKIALTFDDGPNPTVTPRLLELFDRHSVRATFFLIGKFARACPDLVKEISARGHLIGNHTDTHANLIFARARAFAKNWRAAKTLLPRPFTRSRPAGCGRPTAIAVRCWAEKFAAREYEAW